MASPQHAGRVNLDELLAPSEWDAGRCTVPQGLEAITDEAVRAKVAAAVMNPRVPPANVEEAFRQLIGKTPKQQAIRRHRSRGCNCD